MPDMLNDVQDLLKQLHVLGTVQLHVCPLVTLTTAP